jgi:hypothetical protein
MDLRCLAAATFAALATATAAARDGGLQYEVALDLEVGEAASICPCPVFNVICDDPSVAAAVDMKDAVGLKGVAPGATLCSARDSMGIRRFYRVKVRRAARDGAARDGGAR